MRCMHRVEAAAPPLPGPSSREVAAVTGTRWLHQACAVPGEPAERRAGLHPRRLPRPGPCFGFEETTTKRMMTVLAAVGALSACSGSAASYRYNLVSGDAGAPTHSEISGIEVNVGGGLAAADNA